MQLVKRRSHRVEVSLGQLRVLDGDGVVGRALEHRQVSDDRRNRLDQLDAGRCGADDADTLAGKVNACAGPTARVKGLAGKIVAPGNLGDLGLRQSACVEHDETGLNLMALVCPHGPQARGLIEDRRDHTRLKVDVAPQVELVDHMVEVAGDLGLRRESLGPVGVVPQGLGEPVLVMREV